MKTKEGEYLCQFSDDELYRYAWVASWGKGKPLMVVGLNPSTADENQTDPTVAKCVQYAKDWKFPGLIMANAFAYRSTDPKKLYELEDPVGERNDFYLKELSTFAGCVLLAWGNHATYRNRSENILKLFNGLELFCLKTNKNGEPAHPLYLKKSIKPIHYIP